MNQKKILSIIIMAFLSFTSLIFWFEATLISSDVVFVLYAGSLVHTYETELIPTFEEKFNYNTISESRGSLQCARMVLDNQRAPDVFVSAGLEAMELLISENFVSWYFVMVTEEIVFAYSRESPHFNDLEAAREGTIPWVNIFALEGFKLGWTNPNLDPKGYYTYMLFDLASRYYNDSDISTLLSWDLIYPEETLMSQLEAGMIDSAVAYRHEAQERGYQYITLPLEINFGDLNLDDIYATSNFTSRDGTLREGRGIRFAISIPTIVKNIRGAVDFLIFQLGDGRKILQASGFKINRAIEFIGELIDLPEELQPFVDG